MYMNKLINVNANEGDKVIFVGEERYSLELEYAKKKLEIGKEYTVAYTIANEFQATICIEESSSDDFDTYMFIDADKKDQYIIEYLCENNMDLGLIKEEAELILYEIKDIILDDQLISFIQEDLSIFRSKEKALTWFNDGEEISRNEMDFKITQDMVGKDVIDVVLENKENCIKINDILYLTWWL